MLRRLAAVVLNAALLAGVAHAQFEDELADEPAAAERDPAPPAEEDAAADAVGAPPVQPIDPLTIAAFARSNPAVAAALEMPRETPAQKFRAVSVLVDLGHPELADRVLPELLAEQLDDAARAALVREFGAARFMRLIRLDQPIVATEPAADEPAEGETPDDAVAPPPPPLAGARAFAQACLDAAAAEARNPERLAALIAALHAATEEQRYAARVDLRATGEPGLSAAFAALAAAPDDATRANLIAALAEMRPAVDLPTLAVLADARGPLRRDAAELAGRMRLGAALPLLSAIAASTTDAAGAEGAQAALRRLRIPVPTPADAQQLIRNRLQLLEEDAALAIAAGTGGVWWSWNPETRQLTSAEYSPRQLRTLAAARLTNALNEAGGVAAPSDRRLAVVHGLEVATMHGAAPSKELQALIVGMTPGDVSAALADAVAGEYLGAATQLATELGRRGDLSVLATADGQPSPLATAVGSPHRPLRFAALSSVMQLAPPRSFPGASYVPEALWYFASGAGDPTAVVAAPVFTRASDWAGQLRGAGFQATPAGSGRYALAAANDAATAARLAVVVLDSDIGQPLVGETVYQLRSSPRTARVPVLIASSLPNLQKAQRIADGDRLVLAAPRPHGDGALAALVEQTVALNSQAAGDPQEHATEAAQALAWIAELLENRGPYDELLRDAALVNQTLYIDALAAPSIRVLAAAGSAESQTVLVDYASSQTLPIAGRRAAAAALAKSVERFGVQLTVDQIHAQYDRYNASETADADTQQVLGQVLDVLESKQKPSPPSPDQSKLLPAPPN